MKALVVDGEELFRISLKEVVSLAGNFEEVLDAGSEHEFLTKTANYEDLALVVVHPDTLTKEGGNCLKLVRRLYPDAAIVIINDDNMGPGPQDYNGEISINRSAKVSQVIGAIRRALKLPMDGVSSIAARGARPDARAALAAELAGQEQEMGAKNLDISRLSLRQQQILAMASDGLPNKEIAARLSIAEGTVKAHMHAIFKVLGVSNRTQAVIRYGAVARPMLDAPTGRGKPASWSSSEPSTHN